MTDIELLHTITMPTRYQILMLLLEHHYCGKALAAKIGISEAAISQHLQILKDCGIVTGQRIDRQMHYQVNTELLIQSVGIFHQKYWRRVNICQIEITVIVSLLSFVVGREM